MFAHSLHRRLGGIFFPFPSFVQLLQLASSEPTYLSPCSSVSEDFLVEHQFSLWLYVATATSA